MKDGEGIENRGQGKSKKRRLGAKTQRQEWVQHNEDSELPGLAGTEGVCKEKQNMQLRGQIKNSKCLPPLSLSLRQLWNHAAPTAMASRENRESGGWIAASCSGSQ